MFLSVTSCGVDSIDIGMICFVIENAVPFCICFRYNFFIYSQLHILPRFPWRLYLFMLNCRGSHIAI